MLKTLFIVFAAIFCVAVGYRYTGSCGTGSSCTWGLENGKLTISGTGKMTKFNSAAEPTWMAYKGDITSLEVGNSIKNIGDYAFSGCSQLKSVSLGISVSEIGDHAFEKTGITSIKLFSHVKKISDYAFYKSKLTSAWIQSGKIGKFAFCGCSDLTSVTFSTLLYEIEDKAFQACTSLTSVSIPSTVSKIDTYAFADCTSLHTLEIGNGVQEIEEYAFSGCTSLESITFGHGLSTIEIATFADCKSLTNLSIPGSITSIGDQAFYGCSHLSSVEYFGTSDPGPYSYEVFTGCDLNNITVPSYYSS